MSSLSRDRPVRALLAGGPIVAAGMGVLAATAPGIVFAVAISAAAGVLVCAMLIAAAGLAVHHALDLQIEPATSAHEGRLSDLAQLVTVRQHGRGLYPDWYFHLRLEEEMDRAERYGLHFTLLVLTKPEDAETVGEWFSSRIQPRLRKTDLPALLDDGRLAVLLLHTQRAGALRRRLTSMPAFGGTVGFACFPEDGEDVATLMDIAGRTVARTPEEERRPIARAPRRKVRLTFEG
jgi:hypothetical protein